MRIAFVPIDNRPVCYTLPKLIAAIDSEIELIMPDRKYLGGLNKPADVEKLFEWMLTVSDIDAAVLSLDTLAYGGLIPSRRCSDSFEEIRNRIFTLREILEGKNCKVYAFSSIMRISNNNYNEEEKEYWSQWGKKIFEYSYLSHKTNGKCRIETGIPSEILDDYIETRRRNFEINKIYLDWQKKGLLDTLIFSKDDCAQYGFNVQEAQVLERMGGYIKTGADEIPLSLLSCAISGDIKICPIFLEPKCKDLISNYEDISIESSVYGQLELAGCKISSEEEADILLYVNNFKKHQGEIVMKVSTEPFRRVWCPPQKPYMIADVRFANGADNFLVKQIFDHPADEMFCGFAAWNTSANTLGSLICAAKVKFLAKKYNKESFLKLQMTRFMDDWAYQANCRQKLEEADVKVLRKIIEPYKNRIQKFLNRKYNTIYKYPWNRLFEVEIECD